MKLTKILDKAETLDFNQRWKYMIELGRDSLNDEKLASSLLELSSSAVHYERLLALMSAHGSFNKEIITRILEDPSVIGMGYAVKLAAEHLDSDKLTDIVPRLSPGKRSITFSALLKARRMDVIESIYAKSDVFEQQNILLYTSEIFFKEHIDQDKIESFTENQWRQMARRFPDITYEQLVRILKESNEQSWLTQQAVHAVLHQFYKMRPAVGLSLLNQAVTYIHPNNLCLDKYSIKFPESVAELILNYPAPLSVSLPVTVLRKLKCEVLCALAEKKVLTNLIFVFPKLHPEQRTALYRSLGESLRNDSGALPLSYVRALPNPMREEESMHAYNLKILEAHPMERLPYLSVLPFSTALPLATPFLDQPEGELRASAVSALVQCGRYYSSELDKILDFCLKRENEQDPVRLEMITALSGLPPTRWSVEHLPKLKLIIAAALQARDCSYQTMQAATRLLFKMLTLHTDFVMGELPILVERMGYLSAPSLESHISNADMIILDTCLLPQLKTWVSRNRAELAVSLIQSFGRRIKSVYRLQKREGRQLGSTNITERKNLNMIQLLMDLTQDKRWQIARMGLEALIRMDLREEVSLLIPRLIKQDPSWMWVNHVSKHVHRYRQSLLTPFLKPHVYSGRFSSGKTAMLLSFDSGFVRWTAKQQQIYAESLNDILGSNKRTAWELYACARRLGNMPSIELTPLINLAQYDAKDSALRDKALEALGRADAGRGVPTLLQALEDKRAGIAIYALRHSLLNMPAKSALALLSKAPRNKITVEKEIIRLAGEFSGEDAYNFLNSFAKDEDLHRDLKIALLRAFWKHLDTEGVWAYFHEAAQSGPSALARSTIRIPQEGLSPNGRFHLCEQLTILLQNESALVRTETLTRLVQMPPGQTNDAMFEALSKLLNDIDINICNLAAKAMLAMYVTKDAGKLMDTFTKITRPKAIAAIVDAFQIHGFANVSELRGCAESLSFALIEQRCFPSQALRLAVMLLQPFDIFTVIKKIDDSGLLHPGAIESGVNSWNKSVKAFSQQDIAALETKLRTSPCEGMRRLGLGLLTESAGQNGWTKERREHLGRYCADASLWISEAAGLVEPPQFLEMD